MKVTITQIDNLTIKLSDSYKDINNLELYVDIKNRNEYHKLSESFINIDLSNLPILERLKLNSDLSFDNILFNNCDKIKYLNINIIKLEGPIDMSSFINLETFKFKGEFKYENLKETIINNKYLKEMIIEEENDVDKIIFSKDCILEKLKINCAILIIENPSTLKELEYYNPCYNTEKDTIDLSEFINLEKLILNGDIIVKNSNLEFVSNLQYLEIKNYTLIDIDISKFDNLKEFKYIEHTNSCGAEVHNKSIKEKMFSNKNLEKMYIKDFTLNKCTINCENLKYLEIEKLTSQKYKILHIEELKIKYYTQIPKWYEYFEEINDDILMNIYEKFDEYDCLPSFSSDPKPTSRLRSLELYGGNIETNLKNDYEGYSNININFSLPLQLEKLKIEKLNCSQNFDFLNFHKLERIYLNINTGENKINFILPKTDLKELYLNINYNGINTKYNNPIGINEIYNYPNLEIIKLDYDNSNLDLDLSNFSKLKYLSLFGLNTLILPNFCLQKIGSESLDSAGLKEINLFAINKIINLEKNINLETLIISYIDNYVDFKNCTKIKILKINSIRWELDSLNLFKFVNLNEIKIDIKKNWLYYITIFY